MKGIRLIQGIFVVILLVAFTQSLQANIKLEVQLSDSTLIMGDEITAQLKVDGAKDNVAIQFPDIEGLSFRLIGPPSSSSQTIIINGKVTRFSGLVYTIGISADKVGYYHIPGIKVNYDNNTYISEAFNLRVRAPDQISGMKVATEVSARSLFLYQPLVITLKWYVQDEIEDYIFRFPLLDRKDEIGLKLRESKGAGAASNLNVSGYKIPFTQSAVTLDDGAYTVYQAEFEVFPSAAGEFHIPAAGVKASIRAGYELRQDFFGREIRTPKLKRIFATSEPIAVKIKSLPEKNRPTTFTGAVGQFEIQLSTDAKLVKVGDPVELAIRIRGEGQLDQIERPVLSEIPEYQRDFAIVDNLQPGDIQEESVSFRQIIRPRHDGVTRIPPVVFSYFNPVKEKYVTINSNSLILKVLPARQVTEHDIVAFNEQHPEPNNSRLTRKQTGIYANYTFEDALESQTQAWSWRLLLLLLTPPFLYFSSLLIAKRYQKIHSDSALARAKSATAARNRQMKKAKRLIEAEDNQIYQELSRAISGFISDKLNLGTGELTTVEIEELRRSGHLNEALTERIIACQKEFDRQRFTNGTATAEQKQAAYNEVAGILKDLGKAL